jgi:hypothetical protein
MRQVLGFEEANAPKPKTFFREMFAGALDFSRLSATVKINVSSSFKKLKRQFIINA